MLRVVRNAAGRPHARRAAGGGHAGRSKAQRAPDVTPERRGRQPPTGYDRYEEGAADDAQLLDEPGEDNYGDGGVVVESRPGGDVGAGVGEEEAEREDREADLALSAASSARIATARRTPRMCVSPSELPETPRGWCSPSLMRPPRYPRAQVGRFLRREPDAAPGAASWGEQQRPGVAAVWRGGHERCAPADGQLRAGAGAGPEPGACAREGDCSDAEPSRPGRRRRLRRYRRRRRRACRGRGRGAGQAPGVAPWAAASAAVEGRSGRGAEGGGGGGELAAARRRAGGSEARGGAVEAPDCGAAGPDRRGHGTGAR
jgi:hypothetical protein